MTTRSQKRKAVAELVSGELEASTSEKNLTALRYICRNELARSC